MIVNITATDGGLDAVSVVVIFALAADIGSTLATEELEEPDSNQNQREEVPEGAADIAEEPGHAEDYADAKQPERARG